MKFTAITALALFSVAMAIPDGPGESNQEAAAKVAEPVHKHLAERYPVLEKRKKGSSSSGGSHNGNSTE
ncbi:hypothetical protein FQN49_007113, partial [Arthroderma sp. PD_2]